MKEELKYPDQRSKRFVFAPFCLTCQAFQARGLVRFGFSSTIRPVLQELLNQDVNIIQMPCPESKFGGYDKGLKRLPKGFAGYDVPEFQELCDREAANVVEMIKAIQANDFQVVAILGIEYSPSCAISLQYSGRGTFHRSGIFIEKLKSRLAKEGIIIPFMGINRRGVSSSIKNLRNLLQEKLL